MVSGFCLKIFKKTSAPKTMVCVFFTAFDLALPQLTRPRTLPKEVEPKKTFCWSTWRNDFIWSGACSFLGFFGFFWGVLFEKTKVTHGIFGIHEIQNIWDSDHFFPEISRQISSWRLDIRRYWKCEAILLMVQKSGLKTHLLDGAKTL